jgi:hypothetical protein
LVCTSPNRGPLIRRTAGRYYGVDLGAAHTLTRIIWDSSLSANDLPRGLDVQISPDGTTYTTVLSIPDTSGLSNASVPTIDTGSTSGNYLSLHELSLFGE